MPKIPTVEFMKFCISQGFEFVLVDEENKVVNNDNVEELDKLMDRNGLIPLDMRKTNEFEK